MNALPEKVGNEIKRCQKDPDRLQKKWLKILTKQSKIVQFKRKRAQNELIKALRELRWMYVLKARQIGATTAIGGEAFSRALMRPNYRVLVVADTREAAENIFGIYKRFYDELPDFLKFRCDTSNVRELKFFHGGLIRVTSAGSGGVRGTTYNFAHLSEFAFWKKPQEAIAAIMQTMSEDATVILETTANGINDAQRIWQEDNGFEKRFISWLDEPSYVLRKAEYEPNAEELNYIRTHRLPPERANWYIRTLRTKCAGNQNTFDQEYPITPALAFITSGKKFFTKTYIQTKPPEDGLVIHHKPVKYRVYSAGIDTASGSPEGDWSTVVISDVTDKKNMQEVATLQCKKPIKEFASDAYDLVSAYNALAVIEVNSYGLSVQEFFEGKHYDHLYVRNHWDKLGHKYIDKLGWWTDAKSRPLMLSRLNQHMHDGSWTAKDQRLMGELNSFVFDDAGKPQAAQGAHDDLVVAAALSLMGLDQIDPVRKAVTKPPKNPSNIGELLMYEAQTGLSYKDPEKADQQEAPPSAFGDW